MSENEANSTMDTFEVIGGLDTREQIAVVVSGELNKRYSLFDEYVILPAFY
jgi:hypothetical protein